MSDPYEKIMIDEWQNTTIKLVNDFPISMNHLKKTVQECWDSIFNSIFNGGYTIGKDIFPQPQIMGFFLHVLICLEITKLDPDVWRCEEKQSDKDIVNISNPKFSLEIKTSSHKTQIFGNRSYAQKSVSKKSKDGYYLIVNFEKFTENKIPKIRMIRFGWLKSS